MVVWGKIPADRFCAAEESKHKEFRSVLYSRRVNSTHVDVAV
jgi:hypothetical protein